MVVEPRISGEEASTVIKKLGFPRSHHVEASGFLGGIWNLWKEDILSVEILLNRK